MCNTVLVLRIIYLVNYKKATLTVYYPPSLATLSWHLPYVVNHYNWWKIGILLFTCLAKLDYLSLTNISHCLEIRVVICNGSVFSYHYEMWCSITKSSTKHQKETRQDLELLVHRSLWSTLTMNTLSISCIQNNLSGAPFEAASVKIGRFSKQENKQPFTTVNSRPKSLDPEVWNLG